MIVRSVLIRIFIIFPVIFLSAQTYPDEYVDKKMKAGLRHLIFAEFDSAKTIFEELDESRKELPVGKLFLGSMEIVKSWVYGEMPDTEYSLNQLDRSMEICDSLLEIEPDNIWYNYFAGMSHGYYGYYQAAEGNIFSAIYHGIRTITYSENCLNYDPEFYEAYIAIGVYLYFRSKNTEIINWLPFIEDEREEGIRILEKAIEKKTIHAAFASTTLIVIYHYEKKFEKALKLAEESLQLYPNSIYFQILHANAMANIDEEKAIGEFEFLLKSIGYNNETRFNEIYYKHRIAILYAAIGENEKSLQYCDEILAVKDLTEAELDLLDGRIDKVSELKNSLLSNN